MLKWRQGQDALERKAVAWPGKWIRTTKVTSKPEQGMNFTVNIDFWFWNDDFCKKPEGKKYCFCRFSIMLKLVILFLSKFKRWYFEKSTDFFAFIGYPNLKDFLLNTQNWQLWQRSHDWESCNALINIKQRSLLRPVLAGTDVNGLKGEPSNKTSLRYNYTICVIFKSLSHLRIHNISSILKSK